MHLSKKKTALRADPVSYDHQINIVFIPITMGGLGVRVRIRFRWFASPLTVISSLFSLLIKVWPGALKKFCTAGR